MAEPTGWYNDPDPEKSDICFKWDGDELTGPYLKSGVLALHVELGLPDPEYMTMAPPKPAAEPAPVLDKGWFNIYFKNNQNAPALWRYSDGQTLSEYFSAASIIGEIAYPEFCRQGGDENWFEKGCAAGSDKDLWDIIVSRVTPEQAREKLGDTAPIYNNGPTWIKDENNPNLARWWDGNDFTEKTELIGTIQQHQFDAEVTSPETVSYATGLAGAEAGSWHIDPEDPTRLIHWGGERWDRSQSLESAIAELFADLGEPVPELWAGVQSMSPRHADLMDQLTARKNGVNGWYKEPERFDDLRMRVWHEGQWTDQISQQTPGLYDDPFNDQILREWNVNGWTSKTVTKEAERVRMERETLRQEKRQAFKQKVLVAVADHYSPENMRQRRIDNENDRSRRLRDAAASAALEHRQGANSYYAQKDFDRMWRGKR